ncbi:MAG: hypothetical protein JKY12_01675 [Sneathiella sp.]|nr:hypothetical protein [Sneathiella sp.]
MIVAIVGIIAQLVIALLGLLLTWKSDVIDPKEITKKISEEIQNKAGKTAERHEGLLTVLMKLPKIFAEEVRKKRRIYNALFFTMVLAALLQIFQLYGSLNYFDRNELEQALKNHRVIQKTRVYEHIKNDVVFDIGPSEKYREKIRALRAILDEPIKEIFAQCATITKEEVEIEQPSNIMHGGKGLMAPEFETLFANAAKNYSTKIANGVFLKHFNGFDDSPIFKHMDAPLKISPILIPIVSSNNFASWVEEREKNTNAEVQCDRDPASLYEALSCSLQENLAGDIPKCVFTACYELTEGMGVGAELTGMAREYCQMKGITMEPENRDNNSIFSDIYDKVWEQVRIYDKKKLVEDYLEFKSWYDPIFGGV